MTGRDIYAKDVLGVGRVIALVLCAVIVLLTLTGEDDREIGWATAAAPLLYLIVRSTRTLPSVRFRLGEHSLERLDAPAEIPYSSIEAVTLDGFTRPPGKLPKGALPIIVRHPGDELVIPPAMDGVTAAELHGFLLEKAPARPLRLPAELAEHRAKEIEMFGADKVFSYGGRYLTKPRVRGRGWRCAGLSLALWGILALLPAFVDNDIGHWVGMGVFGLLFGFLCWLLGVSRSGNQFALAKQAGGGIVISPGGVALKQGALSGRLKWEEIRAIRDFNPGAVRITNDKPHGGTLLQLDGTTLVIADVYDAPRETIAGHLRAYWRPS